MTLNIHVSPAGSLALVRPLMLMAMATATAACGFAPQPKSGTVACKPRGGACCPQGYLCVGRGLGTAGGPSAGTCWSNVDLPPEAVAGTHESAPGGAVCLATDWLPPELIGIGMTSDAGSGDTRGSEIAVHGDASSDTVYGDASSDTRGGTIVTPVGTLSAISAGGPRTYLVSSGRLLAWGYNKDGFLGDGTTTNRSHPVAVRGLESGVSAVSTAGRHTCVVASGGVQCWGKNEYGQLGNNTRTDSTAPVPVIGLHVGATAVAVGGYHTCVVVNGGVQCWGKGEYGQIGDGSRVDSLVPAKLPDLPSGVTAIVAGENHTCALVNGGVRCWGVNYKGELGINTESIGSKVPVATIGLETGVTALAASFWQTCAVVQGGGIRCWGNNDSGELGDGTTKVAPAPVQVLGLPARAVNVACGPSVTCAILETGAANCWGSNFGYQIGNGTLDQYARKPTQVKGLTVGVKGIAVGGGHTCATIQDSSVKCWGTNNYGEMGVEDAQYSLVPVDVEFQ